MSSVDALQITSDCRFAKPLFGSTSFLGRRQCQWRSHQGGGQNNASSALAQKTFWNQVGLILRKVVEYYGMLWMMIEDGRIMNHWILQGFSFCSGLTGVHNSGTRFCSDFLECNGCNGALSFPLWPHRGGWTQESPPHLLVWASKLHFTYSGCFKLYWSWALCNCPKIVLELGKLIIACSFFRSEDWANMENYIGHQ